MELCQDLFRKENRAMVSTWGWGGLSHLFTLKVVIAGIISRDEITKGEEVEWEKEPS